jgi:two-component system, NarL family, sensor kinase
MPAKEYEIITGVVIAIVVLLLAAIFILVLVINYNHRKRKHILEKQTMQNTFQQTLLQTQLEIQEQTLKNISQEIHDNIGQGLSLAKLNINTMDSNDLFGLQDKINTSKHLITKAIQDLRDLSKSLNTDYVTDLGLVRSVEYELEMIQKTGSYHVTFDVEGKVYRLEPQQELILFRIVQEVLHNIIRHAQATSINVLFNFEPERFALQISDNGIGFDATQLDSKNYEGFGLGLRNMNNRANIIHADFKLTSTLQKGTTVFVTLDLNNAKT